MPYSIYLYICVIYLSSYLYNYTYLNLLCQRNIELDEVKTGKEDLQ